MAVYQKRGDWWVDFYFQGKRYRQKIGTRKKDAEQALNQIRIKITAGEFVPTEERQPEQSEPQSILFQAFAKKEFLPWSKAQHSAKHYVRLESIVRVHLIPAFGKRHLHEITTKQIEDYKTKRRRSRYKRGGQIHPTSEATVNRELCCIKVILRKAVEWGILEESPAKGIKMFKETSEAPRLLEQEEIAALLRETPDHLRALVTCIVYAGLRREELFYLKWKHINWKARELTVASDRDHHTKNYESRRIPMNAYLVEALRCHRRDHIIVGSPYVFANREGKPYRDVRESLNEAAKRAGIGEAVKLHQLRHAFCSHALMQGVAPRTVQKWMGHKDLKTTLRYAHVSPDHEKAAIERLSYTAADEGSSRAGEAPDTALFPQRKTG
jgi:site-specific recombinase XerD